MYLPPRVLLRPEPPTTQVLRWCSKSDVREDVTVIICSAFKLGVKSFMVTCVDGWLKWKTVQSVFCQCLACNILSEPSWCHHMGTHSYARDKMRHFCRSHHCDDHLFSVFSLLFERYSGISSTKWPFSPGKRFSSKTDARRHFHPAAARSIGSSL